MVLSPLKLKNGSENRIFVFYAKTVRPRKKYHKIAIRKNLIVNNYYFMKYLSKTHRFAVNYKNTIFGPVFFNFRGLKTIPIIKLLS